jgi:FMN phosphatase YigB (HAD superfamily)
VEAARLGVLKPDPEAFRRCAAEIGEAPQRCLFVDDLAVNLDGAAAVGMGTLLFEVRDPGASIAALLARLGLDPGPPPPGPGRVFSVR